MDDVGVRSLVQRESPYVVRQKSKVVPFRQVRQFPLEALHVSRQNRHVGIEPKPSVGAQKAFQKPLAEEAASPRKEQPPIPHLLPQRRGPIEHMVQIFDEQTTHRLAPTLCK